jgi:tRNA (guanosine-2'-O-)-methyltransferase
MALLPRRFHRLRTALNQRMGDLTVLLEAVDKPHNLSAILRTCDAVGVLEAHVVSLPGRPRTFNTTARGSQKWVPLHPHPSIEEGLQSLKSRGFRIFGTHLGVEARDYRACDFTGPTCFLMGAEKWGLSEAALRLVDQPLFIPMGGMVQSLNVSVAAAILLFEALRQRQQAALVPSQGEGIPGGEAGYQRLLFEWAYPQLAQRCRNQGLAYPALDGEGALVGPLPDGARQAGQRSD